MLRRNKSYSKLYEIERSLLAVFYIISVLTVSGGVLFFLSRYRGMSASTLIAVSLFLLVIAVVFWSLIQVISYIPSNLAGAFDPIKNDISSGIVKSEEELAGRLAAFFSSFFRFAFFHVKYAVVEIGKNSPVFSDPDIDFNGIDWDSVRENSKREEETYFAGKFVLNSGSYYLYITPMIFGRKRLGYFGVFTSQRLMPVFRDILTEFENNFIDDQVLHIYEWKD